MTNSAVNLGAGTKVNGNLEFTGIANINCEIEGQILAKEQLTIAESSLIKGKIEGVEIIIKGSVLGDITASKRLSLEKGAKITGNITAPVISIQEGVFFEGKCTMTPAKQNLQSSPQKLETK